MIAEGWREWGHLGEEKEMERTGKVKGMWGKMDLTEERGKGEGCVQDSGTMAEGIRAREETEGIGE